jgi:hypothetical protein
MFGIIDTIDKALETKAKCTLSDKMGRTLHGFVKDSWIRVSGAKMRGKLVFDSEEKGQVEVDANDILILEMIQSK